MAQTPVSYRYIVFVLLTLFCFLWYVKVNNFLFRNSENLEAMEERDTILSILHKLEVSNQLALQPKSPENNDYVITEQQENYSESVVQEDDPEALVQSRVEFTRNVCEEKQFENSYTEFQFKDIGHMLVDDKHRFIFCYIPKVSCTTWKKVLSSIFSTHKVGQRTLSRYSPEDIEYRLKNYRRAMFVRDPITRFLSAFLHKFYTAREKTVETWERAYGRNIIEQYRPWENVVKGKTGLNITVSEFIKYIVNLGEDYKTDPLRDHWLPMYRSCDPCKFQPEFIGHFENLEVEGPYLLKWLGVNDVKFPEYHASDAANKLVNSYANAEMGLMRSLRSYYHRDYELFNYSANDTMRKVLFGE